MGDDTRCVIPPRSGCADYTDMPTSACLRRLNDQLVWLVSLHAGEAGNLRLTASDARTEPSVDDHVFPLAATDRWP